MAAGRILSVADRSEAVLWRDGRSSIPVKTAVGSRFFTLGAGRFRRSPWRAVQSEWMSMTGSSSGEACTTSRSKVSLHELHSIRWAGLWRETPEAARSVRPRARGSVFLHAGEAILAFLHAGEAILAFVRLRTSGSTFAGSSRRSAPLRNGPDVTAAGWAHHWKSLGNPGQELGYRVVRTEPFRCRVSHRVDTVLALPFSVGRFVPNLPIPKFRSA